MTQIRLVIGTPAYGGQVASQQTKMWLELGFALASADDRFLFLGTINVDTQPVDRARNLIVKQARERGADWLLMIDSDVWVDSSLEDAPGSTEPDVPAGHQLLRMISEADRAGATIAGANVERRGGEGLMTFFKSPSTGRMMVRRNPREARSDASFNDGSLGLSAVDAIGTSVFAVKIAGLSPMHEFRFSDVSEDLHFCRSIREAHDDKPGCIVVDDRVRTSHLGKPKALSY